MFNSKLKLDDYSVEYFIEVISAFINDTNLQAKQKINWNEILYLSQIHSLTGLLGYMSQKELSDFKPDQKTLQKLFNIYLYNLQVAVSRDQEYKNIINQLCENKIPHLIVKGYVVKEYYPVKEIRSMGDIDILVYEQDVLKTDNILLKLGYVFVEKVGFVNEYSNGENKVEIHTKLFSSTNLNKNSKIIEYFNKCWENVSTTNGYTYKLNTEYHLIFLISHMAKHFRAGGCGIRMIMDIAVYIKYFNGQLDYNYILKELEGIELTQFAMIIFMLCKTWFKVEMPDFTFVLPDETIKELSDFIIKRGIFGDENKNIFTKDLIFKCEDNRLGYKYLIKMITFLKHVFPDRKTLKSYTIKEKNSRFYIFLAWFKRVYVFLFKKSGFYKKLFTDIKNAPYEAKSVYKMLKDIGL